LASLEQQLLEIQKKLKQKIKSAMIQDVVPAVIETEKKHIQIDIYAAYQPHLYKRTGDLLQDSNFQVEIIDDGVIITNETYHNGKNISEIMETGIGWSIEDVWGYGYSEPRPFVENTKNEILATGIHKKKLKDGLIRQGLNVK